MNRKRNKSKGFNILKYLPAILIYVLIFPTNYSGKILRLKTNACGPEFPNNKYPQSTVKSNPNVNDATTSNPADEKVDDTEKVTGNVVIISLLMLVLSTILITIILRYFYGLSIVKQSLVLFLYQDRAKLLLLFNGLLSLGLIIVYCYGSRSRVAMPPIAAKIMAYCIASLSFHTLLSSNVLAFLHLYSMKKMAIVPPLKWMEDESVAMKKMRLTSFVLVTFGKTLLFAYQAYPKLYYIWIGDMRPFTELPIGTSVHALLNIFLVITYTISSVVATFYAPRCVIVGDTMLPRFPWPIIFFIAGCIGDYLYGREKIWIALLTVQICVGVLAPIAVIATSYQLRRYVQGILQDFQDATLFIKDFLPIQYLSRAPQVHPIQE